MNSRRLARGQSRADVEEILGSSGTLIRPAVEPPAMLPPRFDAIFMRPYGKPRTANDHDPLPATVLPPPRFDNGDNYAIHWGRPGQFIRLYFDKSDRVVGIEGLLEDDPPPMNERVQALWRTIIRE
jgi:hypothetical protein